MADDPAPANGQAEANVIAINSLPNVDDAAIDPVLLVIPGPATLTANNQHILANTVGHLQGKPTTFSYSGLVI